MANIQSIISAQLSQRQRQINQQSERAALFDPDRLLCNIIRVDSNIDVPDRPGFVWCQEYSPLDDTSPFHAFNNKVQAREGLTVWIGKGLGGRREVLDWNNGTIVNTADYSAQKYLPIHHADHEWPNFKPGPDVVNVYPRSLTMLRTYPGEGGALTISVSPLTYVKSNALVIFAGKIGLDISASQPASGLARFVGIYLDPDDNTVKSVNGATTGDSPAITPDSPVFPESAILSANVRLNGDQTVFSEVDMVDVRQILDASGAIDGARVSKLISPDGLTDPVANANNSGDVGIGTTGQDARLDVLDTGGAQLRLTFEDGVKFADFTLDTNHDLTIKPSSTGQVIFQPTSDSVDFFQVLDANGGTPVLNVDSTNERVGIGNAAPVTTLDITGTVQITDDIQHAGDTDTKIGFTDDIQTFTAGGEVLLTLTEAAQDVVKIGDGGDVDINFNDDMFLRGSDGFFGVATVSPQTLVDIAGTGALLTVGDGTGSAAINVDGAAGSVRDIPFFSGSSARWIFRVDGTAEAGSNVGSDFRIFSRTDAGAPLSTPFLIKRSNGFCAIGNIFPPAGQLDIVQAGSAVASPVLKLRQADVSEEFIRLVGTGASAVLTQSIVDEGDVTTATRQGFIKVFVQDDGNRIADQAYFMPLFTLA